MLCSSALRRVATQAHLRPTTDVTAIATRLQRLSLFNGSTRVRGPLRTYATTDRPVGRPKKGGAVTAKAKPAGKGRAPAKKAAAKPKKAVKKKTKAAPKKRVLTAVQKEAKERKEHKALIKELKATSLEGEVPKQKPATAWTIFIAERMPKGAQAVRAMMKEASPKYKSLSPAEREHYNHLELQAKADNKAQYKRWVESHSPEQILKANAARRRLRHILTKDGQLKKGSSAYKAIVDDRQVKRPAGAYVLFSGERYESGDLKAISLSDSGKLVREEWKAMSQAERKVCSESIRDITLQSQGLRADELAEVR